MKTPLLRSFNETRLERGRVKWKVRRGDGETMKGRQKVEKDEER